MGYTDLFSAALLSPGVIPSINLATSGNGGVTGTLPFANLQAAQIVTGTAATVAGTATSGVYTPFTKGPTVTFTPLISGNYLVLSNVYPSAAAGLSTLKISTSAGFALPSIVLWEYESASVLPATTGSVTCFSAYQLAQGSAYSFQMYGKNSAAGAVTLHNESASSGCNMLAFQLS